MSIECVHCGAELVGAVNRCWKCGQSVTAVAAQGAAEPAAQNATTAAAEEADAAEAAPAEAPLAAPVGAGEADVEVLPPLRIEAEPDPQPPVKEAASPFAQPETGKLHSKAPKTQYPRNIANVVGGYLALLLGIGSLVEAYYVPLAAVITALIGLMCGLWGVKGRRRTAASMGMALCCIALAWGSFNSLVQMYEHQTGRDPFAPNVVQPVEEDDPFADPLGDGLGDNL